eukprot:scaffold149768_cov34-Prasinocladus_malaysianus.AAC.1
MQSAQAKQGWSSWLRGGSSAKGLEDSNKQDAGTEEGAEQAPRSDSDSKGSWRSWVSQAATKAGSVAGISSLSIPQASPPGGCGFICLTCYVTSSFTNLRKMKREASLQRRAVANAKTAAGGASKVAGIVYRTGTGAYSEVRKIAAASSSATRLEQYARNMPLEDRGMALKRWVAVLKSLDTDRAPEPEAKDVAEDEEDASSSDDIAGHDDGMEQDLVAKAHKVLFYDESVSSEPMNFRGLFLRSQALEMIALNFLHAIPSEEEQALLLQLCVSGWLHLIHTDLCMGGTHQQHAAVVDSLVQFSHASQEHNVELAVPKE